MYDMSLMFVTEPKWGENTYGQLGNSTNIDSNVPVQVSSLTNIIAIAAGDSTDHTLALKSDSTVWAWGMNQYGQLGDGTNTDSNFPVALSSLSGVIAVSCGGWNSYALKIDGSVWAWGISYGSLPVQITSLSGIIAISAGDYHTLALRTDGTVWAWGLNDWGQLGNGTYTNSFVPYLISSLTGITAISAGDDHSLALKSDGTVWTWGWNYYGQLGNGTTTDSNLPIQVSSLTGIVGISTGFWHSFAIKNDSTLWAWGRNNAGQLGTGTNISSSVPVNITITCPLLIGVDEITEQDKVTVYPNPSTRMISFDGLNSSSLVEVMDITGRLILSEMSNSNTYTLDLGDKQKGLYFCRITDDQGRVQQGKIILQ